MSVDKRSKTKVLLNFALEVEETLDHQGLLASKTEKNCTKYRQIGGKTIPEGGPTLSKWHPNLQETNKSDKRGTQQSKRAAKFNQ